MVVVIVKLDSAILKKQTKKHKTKKTYSSERPIFLALKWYHLLITLSTWPHRAVGNVSSHRCESDCRSRGCEFGPGPVPYFSGN